MQKNIVILSFIACVFLCASYTVTLKTSGSHPGSTGAPLDLTCAQGGCHTDAQVTLNAVNNNTLIYSAPDSSYVPGQQYTITVQTKGPDAQPSSKFGFELVAIKDADSMDVGQYTILFPTRTQIINHLVGTDTRYSVTHRTQGTPTVSFNFNQWVFRWTAPPVNEGTITFYYATNATNSNGANTGDKIYLHKFQIHPANVASLREIGEEFDMRTVFDPESNSISLSYDLKGTRMVQVAAFDIAGKVIYEGPAQKLSGEQKQSIRLGTNPPKGTYLIQVSVDNRKATKKLLVN